MKIITCYKCELCGDISEIREKIKQCEIDCKNKLNKKIEFFNSLEIGDTIEDIYLFHEALVTDKNETQIKLKWLEWCNTDEQGNEINIERWYDYKEINFNNYEILKGNRNII